jgi:hypothetical protein
MSKTYPTTSKHWQDVHAFGVRIARARTQLDRTGRATSATVSEFTTRPDRLVYGRFDPTDTERIAECAMKNAYRGMIAVEFWHGRDRIGGAPFESIEKAIDDGRRILANVRW